MGRKLNIQPQFIMDGAGSDLLTGPGAASPQPRIRVTKIVVVAPVSPGGGSFVLYKGASGASVAGTEVLAANLSGVLTGIYDVDFVLESGDVLTGVAASFRALTILVSAEIEF